MIKKYISVLRCNNYIKNFIIFVPLISSQSFDKIYILNNIFTFFTFCIFSSIVYIFNDLTDLEYDKQHSIKRKRALASGQIKVSECKFLIFLLLISGLAAIYLSNIDYFAFFFISYVFLNFLYSKYLKKIVLFDIFLLSIFLTSRALIGNLGIHFNSSLWLIVFLFFMFFCLACFKRLSEILNSQSYQVLGRKYNQSHINLLKSLSLTFFIISLFIISYYLNFIIDNTTYKKYLWLNILIAVYIVWMFWIYKNIINKQIHSDPVMFAIKDKISYLLFLCVIIILFVSSGV